MKTNTRPFKVVAYIRQLDLSSFKAGEQKIIRSLYEEGIAGTVYVGHLELLEYQLICLMKARKQPKSSRKLLTVRKLLADLQEYQTLHQCEVLL